MDARDLDMLKKPKQAENGSVDYEQPEIKTDRTTDDCISRAEAIDAIRQDPMGGLNYKRILCSLPSAQIVIDQIRWERDTAIQQLADLGYGLGEKPRTDADCISRQAAIDALCAVCGEACDKSEFVYNAPQDEQVILCPEHYCLCTLPSAQPDPDIINLQKEQAYMQGYEDGQAALREELWERERERWEE